jgi:thiosulfate dehydrogenase [quinone] large subunit
MSTTTRGDLSVTTQTSQSTWYHGFTQALSTKYWAAAARIGIGFVFLWAFLDKNFGWQYTTPKGQGWMFATGDGSPTFGFLNFGVNPEGPFAGFFNNLGVSAGVANTNGAPTLYPGAWVNWLFMLGLLGIGLSLVLGFMTRIGTVGGVVLLFMMWLAEAPWANTIDPETGQGAFTNPVIDDHVIYAIAIVMLMLFTAERTWGVGKWWQSTTIVKRFPCLG